MVKPVASKVGLEIAVLPEGFFLSDDPDQQLTKQLNNSIKANILFGILFEMLAGLAGMLSFSNIPDFDHFFF